MWSCRHWQRGPDVLISTKTQFSSYLNNKNNRYEEAVGEADNLRDRHPMAAMGFVYLVRTTSSTKRAFELPARSAGPAAQARRPFDATMLFAATWDDELTLGWIEDPAEQAEDANVLLQHPRRRDDQHAGGRPYRTTSSPTRRGATRRFPPAGGQRHARRGVAAGRIEGPPASFRRRDPRRHGSPDPHPEGRCRRRSPCWPVRGGRAVMSSVQLRPVPDLRPSYAAANG